MRSEYVFAATKEISNRFMLCRVTSVSARRLHRDSTQPSQTINESLRLIASAEHGEQSYVVKSMDVPVDMNSDKQEAQPVIEVDAATTTEVG